MKKTEYPLYIDALPFAQPRKSGIGHITEGIAVAIADYMKTRPNGRRIYLVAPFNKAKYLKPYLSESVRVKTVLLPAKVLHVLNKYNVLPPMDLLLGRGNYIFPNYRNWRLLRSKSFTYIHDISFIHFKEYTEPRNYEYLTRNVPVWIRRSDLVITASEYVKKEIEQTYDVEPEKVRVVAHGVDAGTFAKKGHAEYMKTLGRYGVTSNGFILHVGNIEPRKNITGLLTAYTQLPNEIKSAHPLVLIGGDGWLNDEIIATIDTMIAGGENIIRPTRYVEDSDMSSFYSAASVLVMPSFYEGYGLPPLQAMASGVPVVVSDNSSLHEIFGQAAFLVDPAEPSSIADGITSALTMSEDDLTIYRNNASAIVRERSWLATAEGLMEAIRDYGI